MRILGWLVAALLILTAPAYADQLYTSDNASTGFDATASGSAAPGWTNLIGTFQVGVINPISPHTHSFIDTAPTNGHVAIYSGATATADMDVVAAQVLPSGFASGNINVTAVLARADITGANYYLAAFDASNTLDLYKRVSGTLSLVTSVTISNYTMTAGQTISVRVRAVGSTIQVKTWANNAQEPTSWNISVTDTGVTAAGYGGIYTQFASGAVAPNVSDFTVDSVSSSSNNLHTLGSASGNTGTISGTYAGTAPTALNYSVDGGSYSAASSPTISGGTFSFIVSVPGGGGAHAISVQNNGSTTETNSGIYFFSGTAPATAYTIAPPTPQLGVRGSASNNWTVTPNGTYTGTITITPSGGGLSSPITLTFSGTAAPQTFTIAPPSKGVVTLTPTASPTLGTDPLPLSYISLPKVNLVFKGDSITYGTNASSGGGTTGGTTYPGVTMSLLQGSNSFFTSVNLGVSGQRLDTMLGNEATEIQPLYSASYDYNILVILAGHNDLGCQNDGTHSGCATVAATLTALQQYCTNAKGYGFKVVAGTTLPGALPSFNFNTLRDQYNQATVPGWTAYANGLIDFASDSRNGWDGDETNTTYYSTDKIHPTDAGYAIMGVRAAEMIWSIANGAGASTGSKSPSHY